MRQNVAVQKFNVTANIQEGRRVIDLAETRGVLGFVPREEAAARRLGLGQFLCGVAQRATSVNRLGDRCRQALAFERRQGGVEDGVGTAKRAEKLSGHTRTQAGG